MFKLTRNVATSTPASTNSTNNQITVWDGTDGSAIKDSGITVSGLATAGVITASGLTMSTARLLGRTTASSGAIEEITVGSGLSLSSGTLTATGGLAAGTQAEQEAASSTSVATTPGRQQYHPSAPKVWGYVTVSGGTPTLVASYNVTSISDDGTGRLGVTIATDFSSASYAVIPGAGASALETLDSAIGEDSDARTAGVFQLLFYPIGGSSAADPSSYSFMGLGDQA